MHFSNNGMRRLLVLLAVVFGLALFACAKQERAPTAPSQPDTGGAELRAHTAPPARSTDAAVLAQATPTSASSESTQAVERKIIRNAELTLESQMPEEAFRKVASLAESRGGFVVNSDIMQEGVDEPERVVISVVFRVPAAQFDSVVTEVRKLGDRVLQDKRTGQDVTQEYIDLEARIRAKRALEAQFLEIMKEARKVSDALEVQRQLAEVRAELEQIEGRRRYLENQSSLSTITVVIRPPSQVIGTAAGGFFSDLREATGDGMDAALGILLLLLKIVIAVLPLLIFVGLPAYFITRYVRGRQRS